MAILYDISFNVAQLRISLGNKQKLAVDLQQMEWGLRITNLNQLFYKDWDIV